MKWGGLYVAISGGVSYLEGCGDKLGWFVRCHIRGRGVSYLEGCGDEVGWFVRCHIQGCELPGGLW